MLKYLELKNYTLAKELSVDFSAGFNIITGESGAGKSVIIGSIELLLGARAQSDVIRFGENKASIEAEFDIKNNHQIKNLLQDEDFDYSDHLIIRREISRNGQNRIFINDSPGNKQSLRAITANLIDLHGQHDHQHLLKESDHIFFLDQLLKDESIVDSFRSAYKKLQKDLDSYEDLSRREKESKDRRELIEFHLQEIMDANLSEEDENALLAEEKQLTSAEEIIRSANATEQILASGEFSLIQASLELKKQFEYLAQFDSSYKDLLKELKSAQAFLDEANFTVQATRNTTEINPDRLAQVQERLFLYEKLKRKYGNSIAELQNYAKEIESELKESADFEIRLLELENTIKDDISQLKQFGKRLSEERKNAKENLEKEILNYFHRLGMPHAELDVRLIPVQSKLRFAGESVAFNEYGFETIEFWIRSNKGLDFLALAKSASGGELSRIMLALKSILAEKDQVSLLVFDEIDAGISGKIASAVGEEMRSLAKHHQIICITHSPQIAGKGEHHYKVSKIEDQDSTESQIHKLSEDERIQELSSLISSGEISNESKRLAETLLKV